MTTMMIFRLCLLSVVNPKLKTSLSETIEGSIKELKDQMRIIHSNQKNLLKDYGLLKKGV